MTCFDGLCVRDEAENLRLPGIEREQLGRWYYYLLKGLGGKRFE